jgi:nitrogen fixation/metabolism regulation signal transduction histidine kinase
MLKGNVIMKSDAAMVKRLINEHCGQLEQQPQKFST